MLIDTKRVLRPFSNETDEELESLETLIRQEVEARVKFQIASGAFTSPTEEETDKWYDGEKLRAMRDYQDRMKMVMRITSVRMIFEHYLRREK